MKKILGVILLTLSVVVLVACGDKAKPPVIEGADDVRHQAREPFEAMEGVTAFDSKDGDITDKVEVDGFDKLDITKAGDYELTYIVVNSKDLETSVVRVVTIFEPEVAPVFSGVDQV